MMKPDKEAPDHPASSRRDRAVLLQSGDSVPGTAERGGAAGTSVSRQSQGRGSPWVALVPALATLGVALYKIQCPSLSRDECATLAAVHRSFPDLLRMLGNIDAVHGAQQRRPGGRPTARSAGLDELRPHPRAGQLMFNCRRG